MGKGGGSIKKQVNIPGQCCDVPVLSVGYLECFKTEGILLFPVLVSVHRRFNVSTTSASVVLKINSGGAYEFFFPPLRDIFLPSGITAQTCCMKRW